MDEVRSRDAVLAALGRSEGQKLLERQVEQQEVRAMESLQHSAQAALEYSEKMFTEMTSCIDRRRSEVQELIRHQQRAAVTQAEGLLKWLESGKNAELVQLLHAEDHSHLPQVDCGSAASPSAVAGSRRYFGEVRRCIGELKEGLEELCARTVPPEEPKTREELLKYFCSFTLDPNTVEKYILLSEEGRVATYKRRSQKYPEHPERFEGHPQVLCRERVSGFCYWEVKWSGRIVNVAISYKEVPRKGRTDECGFGRNQQSWKLCCSQQGFSFWHDNSRTDIPIPPGSSSIVGVFVNHRAGRLAFYSVSGDTVTLLHRVKTTFSQPLYPGFWVGDRSSVKICVE
ncbi:stonustoxin subunit alpha-like [Denticeps clupeoides]|uniref:stonustoxin subunit alpha-like n=1 Tax=Denticeps clupeoides TaxID=299321 RepID=UPI0010A4DF8D|nr:stonustoxin subunit alpha-like [Denticeps clupeoides]